MESTIFRELLEGNRYLQYIKEFEEEISNSSDRGMVLICASIIDNLLEELLKSSFVASSRMEKDIFNPSGIIGTFDARIKMAYYLGLISNMERRNLMRLQNIRNKFAHRILEESFEDLDISNICMALTIPKNGFLPSNIPLPKEGENQLPVVDLNPIKKDTSSRDRFIFTFKYLFASLGHRINFSTKRKCEEETTFFIAEDFILEQINSGKDISIKQEEILQKSNKLLEIINATIRDLNAHDDPTLFKELEETKKVKQQVEDHIEKAEKMVDECNTLLKSLLPIHEYSLKVVQNSMKGDILEYKSEEDTEG